MSRKEWRGAALLLGLVVAVYLPVARAGFIWDDDAYVTDNPAILDLRGLAAAWTTLDATPQYYPLTHTSLFLDHALWGMDPRGYHVTNVLLHAASAIVLWTILARLAVPGALFAAALFAVHPVHVESVAWITERKNTLSCLLALCSAAAFLRWGLRDDETQRPPWAAMLLYLGALLAKTVTATLPLGLAIVLWWKRGRLTRKEISWLVPMLAVGAALGALTRHLESAQLGASGGAWALTFWDRSVLAGRIVGFYLGKVVWPAELIFIYPRWHVDASRLASWIAPVAVVTVGAALLLLARRIGRGPVAAYAFFIVTLAPASGYFNVYPMRYSFVADHFQYMASLGPIVLLAACGAAWIRGRAALAAAALVLLAMSGLAWDRTHAFHDEETLWRDTLDRNPSAWIAHNNLGILLAARGDAAEAETHFRRVLELEPGHTGALANLGYALELAGRDAEAAATLERAAATRPDDADARAHLTRILLRLRRPAEALPHAVEAARLRPDDPEILCDAGTLLASQGRAAEGIPLLMRALSLRPEMTRARENLARARRDAVSSPAVVAGPSRETTR